LKDDARGRDRDRKRRGRAAALLAIDPVHVPAVGEDAATATANVTLPPGLDGLADPTSAIVATVPGELFAPTVHVSDGVKTGCRPACDTVRFCVVGLPPMMSAMLLGNTATGPDDGVGDGDGVPK